MRLESFRLQNFRSILDSGELHLRPLTLLLGPNEAGKSSLLQALGMLKQSSEVPEAGPPLMENGRLVELGSFREFVYRHETSRPLTYEIGLTPAAEAGSRLRSKIDFAYSVRRKSVYLRGYEIGEAGDTPWLSVSADSAGRVERAETQEPPGAAGDARILGRIERAGCLFRIAPAWDRWGGEAGRPISESANSPRFHECCASGVAALERFLGGLAYLGPDRQSLPVVFPITGQPFADVGARGENAPALLHTHRYVNDAAPGVRYVAERLEQMRVGRHLRVVPIEEHLYEITIEDLQTGLVMGLGEVGRAGWQLFPLLVQAYLAQPGATLLLEEPESHLHPGLQIALADFLLEIVRGGRRLVVETYSETLLGRLQEGIREGALAADDLAVYFVQKLEGDTQFSALPVAPDGTLGDFPAGFWTGAGGNYGS